MATSLGNKTAGFILTAALTITACSSPASISATSPATQSAAIDSAQSSLSESDAAAWQRATETVVMSSSGLGIVSLGQDATQVITVLTEVLGKPTQDSGWHPEEVGCGIGAKVREVFWGPLLVQFSSGASPVVADQREHMLMYAFADDKGTTPLLHTDKALVLGSTVATLKKAYPNVRISTSELEGPVFQVDDSPTGLSGALTSLTDDGVVVILRAGALCV
jgi:hypothetical protein